MATQLDFSNISQKAMDESRHLLALDGSWQCMREELGQKKFDRFIEEQTLEIAKQLDKSIKPDLDEIVISHGTNFRISIVDLIELSKYNNYLNTVGRKDEDLKYDNLFLRNIFGGIKNSEKTPPQIFEGFNAFEIYLLETGIFKRKFVYTGEVYKQPRNMHKEPIKIHINPADYIEESRINKDGHLNGTLYEIVEHLFGATGVSSIYKRYKKDWQEINNKQDPNKEERDFKRSNPYDPETLRERVEHIEKNHPEAVEAFKKALAQPFIPERIIAKSYFGNPTEVINRDGFVTPGKTYRRGVKGKTFYRLDEYAKQVLEYFRK